MPSLAQVIVWIIVGLLGGSLAALMITRERKGFGILRNLGIGLLGALVGGLLFRLFGIFPGLDRVAVSLRDVVAALIGSFLVLAVIGLWQPVIPTSPLPQRNLATPEHRGRIAAYRRRRYPRPSGSRSHDVRLWDASRRAAFSRGVFHSPSSGPLVAGERHGGPRGFSARCYPKKLPQGRE